MNAPPVSVIVVSRGRSADLPLCLLGISQLAYPNFEVVLVADPQGLDAAGTLPFFDNLKSVLFDEPNISAARNLGIAHAAGEIVAFIDDDAVPEPTWLTHLVAGFAQPDIACVGGFVRGRNGISFQWKARTVDETGHAVGLDVDDQKISLLTPTPGRAIKTEGTNMAMRRDVLAQMGGFDPAFRFYLDETDVNVRLARTGKRTAIAPLAQVHHGYKASTIRRADRVPMDLFEIGASQLVFLRKHAPSGRHAAVQKRMMEDQRKRVLRHMVAGALEPRDVRRVLASLQLGFDEGAKRALRPLQPMARAPNGFQPMMATAVGHDIFTGRVWQSARLKKQAAETVAMGKRVSLFVLSPTSRPHHVRFTQSGYWLQTGGLFGRSTRTKARVRVSTFKRKIALELRRLSKIRFERQ